MIRCKTASGSIYEIDDNRVRRVERSAISVSERVSQEWRTAQAISVPTIGRPLEIFWGHGRDEHSPDDALDGENNIRLTVTTPVMEIS